MGMRSFFRSRKTNAFTAGTRITGNIHSEHHLTISGTLVGDLSAEGDVVIEKTAEIKGDVTGENVWIAGKVTGDIAARKHLHIAATSSIEGDISYQTLRIEDGAYISGKMAHAEHVPTEARAAGPREELGAALQSPYTVQQPKMEPALPIRNKRVMIQ